MHSDDDDFFDMQPSTSGLILSHMNNKSSVLCPETQNITSQYLALQQLDAHRKMISRAKGCVDTRPPKSMQSYRSVSSQKKKMLLRQENNDSQTLFQDNELGDHKKSNYYNSEEEDVGSTNASFVNKGIQTRIPVSNGFCKTAEKISWYLEAISLGELQSQYFSFMDGSSSSLSKEQRFRNNNTVRENKRIIKGDIMDWHREHFVKRKKHFSPRLLAGTNAKSKIKEMRCYNPPFRIKKISQSHSSDTFESYNEEENERDEEIIHKNLNPIKSDDSSLEGETLINRRQPENGTVYNSVVPLLPHYRRNYTAYSESSVLSQNEEDKYLDFLSKVTEDVLRSGVYSDKAIQQAFEFHLQFYKDDENKEKLQSLLEQVLEGLKITDEENIASRNSFLFSHSIPTTPPEKEVSSGISVGDNQTPDINSSNTTELTLNMNELNLNSS